MDRGPFNSGTKTTLVLARGPKTTRIALLGSADTVDASDRVARAASLTSIGGF